MGYLKEVKKDKEADRYSEMKDGQRDPHNSFSRGCMAQNSFISYLGVYSEEKVQRTLDAMKGRRDNLIKVSKYCDGR